MDFKNTYLHSYSDVPSRQYGPHSPAATSLVVLGLKCSLIICTVERGYSCDKRTAHDNPFIPAPKITKCNCSAAITVIRSIREIVLNTVTVVSKHQMKDCAIEALLSPESYISTSVRIEWSMR